MRPNVAELLHPESYVIMSPLSTFRISFDLRKQTAAEALSLTRPDRKSAATLLQAFVYPMSSAEQCGILAGWGLWQSWASCFAATRSSQSWSIGSVPWAAHGCTGRTSCTSSATAAAASATRLPSFGAGLGAALPELPPLGPFSCDSFTWPWRSYAELQIPRITMTIQHVEVEKPRAKV